MLSDMLQMVYDTERQGLKVLLYNLRTMLS